MTTPLHDIAIIGAGPIGIEAAVSLRQAGFSIAHFEAGQIGSTIAWYAPGTTFFSSSERLQIADVPLRTLTQQKPTREEYLQYLRTVVEFYKLDISLYTLVTKVSRPSESEPFSLQVTRCNAGYGSPKRDSSFEEQAPPQTVLAKKIVLAIGDMHKPQMIGISGEDLPHVSHYLEEPHQYFGAQIVIIGAMNSAVEAAIRLSRLGARVTMVIRCKEFDKKRIKYWLYPELITLIHEKVIKLYADSEVQEIVSDAVIIRQRDEVISLKAERVLALTGYTQDSSLFREIGITLHGERRQAPSYDKDTMETNVSGVYVAGTAVAGTQVGGVREFIETSHIHVQRIVNHLVGSPPPSGGVRPEGEREL